MDINTLTPFVSDALCLLALHHASHLTLRRYLAVAQLIPPAKPDVPAQAATEDVVERPNLFRRIVNARTSRAARTFTLWMLFLALFVFFLPVYGTRFWLDVCWVTFLFVGQVCVIGTSIWLLLPIETKAELAFNEASKNWYPKFTSTTGGSKLHSHLAIGGAAAVTAGCIQASASYGVTILYGLFAAAFVMGAASNFILPRFTTKMVAKVMAIFTIALPLITGLVVGLLFAIMHFFPPKPSEGGKADSGDDMETPSPWVTSLMFIYMLAYPTLYASIITSVSLRFDHVQAHGVPARRGHGPFPVPLKLDEDIAKPTYRAAMLAQLVATLLFRLVVARTGANQANAGTFAFIVTMPASLIASLVSTKLNGTFKLFWDYEEVWVPTEDEANHMVAAEPEKQTLLSEQE